MERITVSVGLNYIHFSFADVTWTIVFCLWENKLENIHEQFNSVHRTLQFTFEEGIMDLLTLCILRSNTVFKDVKVNLIYKKCLVPNI